jgi:hypothetical protein
MLFDQTLGQRQTEASSFKIAIEGAVHVTELRERSRYILRRNADASIDNLKNESP